MKKFWSMLSTAGKVIFSIIILAIIALIVVLIVRNHNKNKDKEANSNTPEIAQTYEPSIGTPLPADVKPEGSGARVTALVENSGEVAGATTSEPSTTTPANSPEQAQQMMIAPKTGIDPNELVAYENKSLKFSATLPAGSEVKESSTTIKFLSKTESLYYIVSVSDAGSENLQSVANQLKNSSTASKITQATLADNKTQVINFTAKGYGQGQVIIANNKIYYLLGNSQYFPTFKF